MSERELIANAFREVHRKIKHGHARSRFICINLQDFKPLGWIQAQRIIEKRLQGYGCLETWLQQLHSIDYLEERNPDKAMRQYRLRWLAALIEEFERKAA